MLGPGSALDSAQVGPIDNLVHLTHPATIRLHTTALIAPKATAAPRGAAFKGAGALLHEPGQDSEPGAGTNRLKRDFGVPQHRG